jgi:hypothetical protein
MRRPEIPLAGGGSGGQALSGSVATADIPLILLAVSRCFVFDCRSGRPCSRGNPIYIHQPIYDSRFDPCWRCCCAQEHTQESQCARDLRVVSTTRSSSPVGNSPNVGKASDTASCGGKVTRSQAASARSFPIDRKLKRSPTSREAKRSLTGSERYATPPPSRGGQENRR